MEDETRATLRELRPHAVWLAIAVIAFGVGHDYGTKADKPDAHDCRDYVQSLAVEASVLHALVTSGPNEEPYPTLDEAERYMRKAASLSDSCSLAPRSSFGGE